MSMNVAEVERALLSLDRRERAEVLHRGIQSLDMDDQVAEDQAEVDAAWLSEIRRRIDDIEMWESRVARRRRSTCADSRQARRDARVTLTRRIHPEAALELSAPRRETPRSDL